MKTHNALPIKNGVYIWVIQTSVIFIESWVERRGLVGAPQGQEVCQDYRTQQTLFKNLGEFHKEWTEGKNKASCTLTDIKEPRAEFIVMLLFFK